MKTAATKAMWVGGATVFLMVPAVAVGLASTALAGTEINGHFDVGS